VVYSTARAYQAGRLMARAIRARMILLDPKYGMHETPQAIQATYEIGGNYQAIAVYDQAAQWYERYAKVTRFKGEHADQALSDAVVLRLGLGQESEAIEDARVFNDRYGRTRPRQAAQVSFAVAAHFADRREHARVERYLRSAMASIDGQASLDVRVQAHALLARAQAQQGRAAAAAAEYATVLALWKDPDSAERSILALAGEDDAAKVRRLGRALESVGEAMFHFADQTRARVDAIRFPEYRGPGDRASIARHINTRVADWIRRKRPLIEAAVVDYQKIVRLRPEPPPRWVIAAGARVGGMWGKFVEEFRAAPIPESIQGDPELRQAYYYELDRVSEPQKQQAKAAFGACLGYSVRYQYFDEQSRSCEEWLARSYRHEYHLVDEFRAAPHYVNDPAREQPTPLRIGGAPYRAAVVARPKG
jgi:hypothetical protein